MRSVFCPVLAMLLVVFATPSPVGAGATVYFAGYAVEVPAWFQLLISGLAMLGVGRLVAEFVKHFRHHRTK